MKIVGGNTDKAYATKQGSQKMTERAIVVIVITALATRRAEHILF